MRVRWEENVLLALVDLDMPLAPDLGRGKHAAGSAHVTKGSLTGTVSTTTRDTGDTSNSTSYDKLVILVSGQNDNLEEIQDFNGAGSIPSVCFRPTRKPDFFSSLPSRRPSTSRQEKCPPRCNFKSFHEARTSSPGLSRSLVASLLAHSIRLALVLGHAGVNSLHDIRSDRAGEDGRDGVGGSRGSTIFADDRDGRSRSHCDDLGGTWTCE